MKICLKCLNMFLVTINDDCYKQESNHTLIQCPNNMMFIQQISNESMFRFE